MSSPMLMGIFKNSPVNTLTRTVSVWFPCDTNKKSAGIASNSSVVPGLPQPNQIDEQIQTPTLELIWHTRKVCREGTIYPQTHYGTCLLQLTRGIPSAMSLIGFYLWKFGTTKRQSVMTPFMYVAPKLRTKT